MNAKSFGLGLAATLLVAVCTTEAQAQSADLRVAKTLTSPEIPPATGANPGENVVYSIVVTNDGPNSATSVIVQDPTPSGLTFVSNTGSCTTAFPCSLGTINAGTSRTITSTYLVPAGYKPPNAIVNEVFVSSATTDPDDSDDYAYTISPVNGINCGNFAVTGGTAHTCAIVAGNGKPAPNTLEDDVVECWGDNFSAQSAPVPSGAFAQISAGAFHTCGLRSNGSVTCWGSNSSGQVANTPVTSDFVQIDAGFEHTCGLRTDNTVVCWGDNTFGQRNAPAGLFTQVAAGNVHSCGLHTNGTIECWGLDGDDLDFPGDPIVTGGPTDDDFVQVVAGGEHVCGRHEDGTVECWGTDFSGETVDPAGSFTDVRAGDEHNCGLRSNSTAECWGDDSTDQLAAPGDAFTSIDTGAYHTCGLLSDGTILCWGDNSALQSTPPGRSDLCPTCGDNVLEGRETCEACIAEFCGGTPSQFASCCSPVTCTAYRLSENHVCREASGACDAPEVCDGINFSTCPPPGPLRPSGYVCRTSLGSCDPAETCTGTSNVCPPNQPFLPSTAPCRIVAGSCDIQENCTGSTAECPADVVKVAGTSCRGAAGVCDIAETCTGTAAACPADLFKTSAVVCRSAVGVCDSAEVCSGAATCPDDTYFGATVTCRPSSTICDAQELCSGTAPDCPADLLASSITPCRAAVGGCDAVERCTGTSTACPADANSPSGTTCRAAIGVCDVAETCAGTGKTCPADAVAASTITCRTAVDACDVAERCTGSTNTCPGNSFAVSGTACNDGAFCNGADTCNGSGACSLHAGDPCPGPDNDANCAESCNEASDNCSTTDPNNSPCSDGNACSNGETCTNGVCGGGIVTECDDGDLCTFDTCDEVDGCVHLPGFEEGTCFEAGKGKLFIKDSDIPGGSSVKWQWKSGKVEITPELLGDPLTDTDYALCIYDRYAGGATLVGRYRIPRTSAGWVDKETRVVFSNKVLLPDGIYKLGAKAAPAGKSSASLKAGGYSIDVPPQAGSNFYFFHQPSLVAQLRNSAGACWTTEFTEADFRRNANGIVKAGFKED